MNTTILIGKSCVLIFACAFLLLFFIGATPIGDFENKSVELSSGYGSYLKNVPANFFLETLDGTFLNNNVVQLNN